MPSISVASRNQLNMLESGLKTLRNSQLMQTSQFKDMYTAVQKHHQDVRLGHLTGMSRDLLEQKKQDAQFYYILLRMMAEVQCSSSGDQEDNLKHVYSWFQANKHVLHSGPRFGKSKKRSLKQKTLSQTPVLHHSENICDSSSEFSILEFLSADISSKNPEQQNNFLEIPVQRPPPEESPVSENKISQVPVVETSPTKQEPEPPDPSLLLKRKVHPVTHLFNPMTKAIDQMYTTYRELDDNPKSASMKVKIGSQKTSGPLHQWDMYKIEHNTNQNELSILQHMGRAGTPGSTRYTAHNNGLPAETLTPNILLGYASLHGQQQAANDSGCSTNTNAKVYTEKNLEDFYELAENYYPTKLPKYPSFQPKSPSTEYARTGSARSRSNRVTSARSAPAKLNVTDNEPSAQVRLETVVKLVDSVTEEMCYHKEKIADEPGPGFRQPAVPFSPKSRPKTAPALCMARPNSPVQGLPSSSLKHQPQPVDWRGCITPDLTKTMGYQYQMGKSVIESNKNTDYSTRPESHRSQGSTQAGARPKTAPVSVQEKWGIDQPGDQITRPFQAASHRTLEVDPNTADQLLTVRHLGNSSKSKRKRYIFNFKVDHDYPDESPPSMEYMSIIAPMGQLLAGSRGSTATRSGFQTTDSGHPESQWSSFGTNTLQEQLYFGEDSTAAEHDLCDPDDLDYELDQITDREVQVNEGTENQSSTQNTHSSENLLGSLAESRQVLKEVQLLLQKEARPTNSSEKSREVHLYEGNDTENRVSPTGEIDYSTDNSYWDETYNGTPVQEFENADHMAAGKKGILKSYTIAGKKDLSRDDDCDEIMNKIDDELDRYIQKRGKTNTFGPLQKSKLTEAYRQKAFTRVPKQSDSLRTGVKGGSVLTVEGRTRKGIIRSAGSVPTRAKSFSHGHGLQKQQEMLRRAPVRAYNTPPSIPSSSKGRPQMSKHNAPFSQELESHARRDKNPRRYMEKVGLLRRQDSASFPVENDLGYNSDLDASLRVNRIVPAIFNWEVTDTPDGVSEGHPGTPVNSIDPDPSLLGSDIPGEEETRSRATTPSRRLVDDGRPIPHFMKIEDPDDYAAAVKMQREASAAVDIQRIFRGYVARNHYKYLQKEEREKRDNQRRAAVEIQRHYRGHLSRKKAIQLRPPGTESLEWAKKYKHHLIEEDIRRQAEAGCKHHEISAQNAKINAKRAVIGPHVYVYDSFHPKKIGSNKSLLNKAATIIQKWARGFLVRQKMKMVKRKARIHAASWSRFVQQYKDLLRRIQSRLGDEKPSAPFDFENISEYMDLKKRYESVFEKRAFGGELEFEELAAYFNECDLYPSHMDLVDAFNLVMRGHQESKGLSKHDVMEVTFQLYPPKAIGITNQHRSTWLSPVIDGEEALKLKGSEIVEPTNFEACWKMVAASKRERQAKVEAEANKIRDEQDEKQIKEWESQRKKQTAKQSKANTAPSSTDLVSEQGEKENHNLINKEPEQ